MITKLCGFNTALQMHRDDNSAHLKPFCFERLVVLRSIFLIEFWGHAALERFIKKRKKINFILDKFEILITSIDLLTVPF